MRSKLLSELQSLQHGIIICEGSGKMGKSCALHTLCGLVPNIADRPHYLLDLPGVDLSMFPGYHPTTKEEIDSIPNGSVVFLEDIARIFPSRGSGYDPTLQFWIGVISHKGLILVISAQSLSDVDIALFRSQNLILLHKLMWDEDLEFERDEFKEFQASANREIQRKITEHPEIHKRAFVFSSRYNEIFALPIIGWWSDDCAHFLRSVPVVHQKGGKR